MRAPQLRLLVLALLAAAHPLAGAGGREFLSGLGLLENAQVNMLLGGGLDTEAKLRAATMEELRGAGMKVGHARKLLAAIVSAPAGAQPAAATAGDDAAAKVQQQPESPPPPPPPPPFPPPPPPPCW